MDDSVTGFVDLFFEHTAERFPGLTAIEHGSKIYSYQQADELANQLARYLAGIGVSPEEKVVILLPRCAEMYIMMLGVLKAGGAYIPLDPEIPAERVNFIMEDSEALLLITANEILERLRPGLGSFPLFNIDEHMGLLAHHPVTKPVIPGRSSSDLCYVIYTSGTTGQPKGVLLEHRNVLTYMEGARKIYPIDNSFRVIQGFSVSFDASVEEIWVPFSVGATVVTGTYDIMRSGEELAARLTTLGISFLSCAPTLLSMVRDDIPTLRILIFGGEVCTTDLAHRWCRDGRMVYNTYGPTEAAVIATYSILNGTDPVTIGKAVPGYEVLIVDEKLQLVTADEEGEILIGGPAIARGYLKRDDLTPVKFLETDRYTGIKTRYYRTGDTARYTQDENINYTGRLDAQVKVRGFRVELAEVEGLLMQFAGVRAAAVTLDAEAGQLAGYIVRDHDTPLDRELIARGLRAKLPYYMIPSTLDVIGSLPMTSSQKIDRKRLPPPQTPLLAAGKKTVVLPRTPEEKALVEAIAKNTRREDISMKDNFFEDLGGHSLLAALITSELRKNPSYARLSVADLYKYPVLSDLVCAIGNQPTDQDSTARPRERKKHRPSGLSYYACTFSQGVALFFITLIFGLEWIGPFFVYSYFYQAEYGIADSLLMMLVMYFATLPVIALLAISLKWIVIGRIKPGEYKLWGSYYFRFWLADKLVNISPISYFTGTPIINVYLRLMGAKIGRNCYINTSAISAFDLLRLGDNVSIGTDSHLKGFTIEDGYLKIGTIDLQDDCYVGTRCCLAHNTVMQHNSSIGDLTLVPEGQIIPAGENWGGSPAAKLGNNRADQRVKAWSKRNISYIVSVFLIPLITMVAYFPGMMVITHFDYSSESWISLLPHIFLVGVMFIIILVLIITALKWVLLGTIQDGIYPVNSGFYHRKWFFDQLMKLSLQVLGTLYTTLYLQIWFRMLGVKMGKRVEISTVEFISPDLLVTGNECFLADSVSIGASKVRNGSITIARTYIGNRTFVGNSAVISPGTQLGDNVLVGVLSRMKEDDLPARDGTSWFGSPAVFLPSRDINREFPAERTYKPSRKLFVQRYAIEFFRVVLPAVMFLIMASLISNLTSYLQVEKDLPELFLLFPFMYLGAGILGTCITILFKWLVIGRYKPANKPLWSPYVWRSELVTGFYENFLVLFFLNMLTGTPFISYPLRLLGCRIGKRVCINTTQVTEFDLVNIGDNSAVNDNCTLQTHLFEDRVMKMSHVNIGKDCSVGGMSVVLYDSVMEEGSILGPLSVLMKSETLPAGNIFVGAPARKM